MRRVGRPALSGLAGADPGSMRKCSPARCRFAPTPGRLPSEQVAEIIGIRSLCGG